MNEKRWAKHIIKRFGVEGARKYLHSDSNCPCIALNKDCRYCKYQRKKYEYIEIFSHCKKAVDFYDKWRFDLDSKYFIRKVKEIIRKRLKNKRIINTWGEDASGFWHKGKCIEKGTKKFRKIMKKWRKQNE